MSRASRDWTPPATADADNVRSDADHAEPSCSTPAHHQAFHPVTQSMTHKPDAVAASPDVKEGESASTSKSKNTKNPCFSTQSAPSRPSVTRVRTPQKVTSSAWKPFSHPVVLSEDLNRSSIPSTDPPAKRARVDLSEAAKDSAAKDSPTVPRGKKNKNEECMSHGDQLDGAVTPSPSKKLQMGKSPSDVFEKWKSTIRNQDGESMADQTSQINQSVGPVTTEAIANRIHQVNQSVVPFTTEPMVDRTSQVYQSVAPVTTEAIANRMHQVNKLVAPGIAFPINLENDIERKFARLPMTTNQASGSAGATAPLVTPKLEIGKAKGSSNVLSDHAYTRALLVQQQQKMLQQYKLAKSQKKLYYIKGPDFNEAPPIEPLGTRCQLCKLDVTFLPQGEDSHDASAPPVVVLSCHHVFHSCCIEAIYGHAEPSECIACLDSVKD
ncbi:hypothetical protein GUJ93_ZPchr0006g45284 [Zizania palustris]|uniref:RING-type domain-containing protein n=1 Tax=Zizania palustris TaxID=103762 RepID=A0A8J5T900_ZIZPA|nr:hypothetical protein GUJ93_ZPchr0006g45284 [Zizania palustris]